MLAGGENNHMAYMYIISITCCWRCWLVEERTITGHTFTSYLSPRLCLGCHNTLTPARTPRAQSNIVMLCIVKWGLFSANISSVHSSIHLSKMETNPPKTECGCPCSKITKRKNTFTHAILSGCDSQRQIDEIFSVYS